MKTTDFDLDDESRAVLELDPLLAWIAGHARTTPGRKSVLALHPEADAERVRAELDRVGEISRCGQAQGSVVPGGLPDPAPALLLLGREGRTLEAPVLRDLAAFAAGAGEIADTLAGLDVKEFPALRLLAGELADFRAEASPILRCVDSAGAIADEASPELRRIRRERRNLAERLQHKLLSIVRAPGSEPVIRDDFITRRNGRYVVPVRVDTPRPIRGIVHATSSSGATQFVEPIDTVETNNRIVELDEREAQEVERILADWTAAFSERSGELRRTVVGVGRLDSLEARARFGRELGAVLPEVESGAALQIEGGRHPLLERRLREQGDSCVPLALRLDPADGVLVLSGPNAGGKTVVLKTLGLLVLMAQSGIPVPALAARLPLYRQLRADIGDHQSIDADLSTYSAHVGAVIRFLAHARPPALFLFDEIGSGTEPGEGAALARSILEALSRPGLTTVATTHLGALKSWAVTDDRVRSAAMDFDTVALRPTYRILPDVAGVSAGLEIAARVGLDGSIIERARLHLGREGNVEEELDRLRERAAEAERRVAELRVERDRVEHRRLEVEREAEERLREGAERAGKALDAALGEFERRTRRALGEIRDARERRRVERAVQRTEQSVRQEHRQLKRRFVRDESDDLARPGEIREGMEVYVDSLGRTGRVRSVRGDSVEVLLGRMPFTVSRDDLRSPPAGGGAGAAPEARAVWSSLRGSDGGGESELRLIGRKVAEALGELDKFLDAAAMAGLAEVRVIHGHGTGRLRRAVRQFLSEHVHVSASRPGKSHEGGDGATVVTLR